MPFMDYRYLSSLTYCTKSLNSVSTSIEFEIPNTIIKLGLNEVLLALTCSNLHGLAFMFIIIIQIYFNSICNTHNNLIISPIKYMITPTSCRYSIGNPIFLLHGTSNLVEVLSI